MRIYYTCQPSGQEPSRISFAIIKTRTTRVHNKCVCATGWLGFGPQGTAAQPNEHRDASFVVRECRKIYTTYIYRTYDRLLVVLVGACQSEHTDVSIQSHRDMQTEKVMEMHKRMRMRQFTHLAQNDRTDGLLWQSI